MIVLPSKFEIIVIYSQLALTITLEFLKFIRETVEDSQLTKDLWPAFEIKGCIPSFLNW